MPSPDQLLAPSPALPLEQPSIQHPHHRERPTNGCADPREEVRPSPPILFELDVEGAHLVEEEHTRESTVRPRVDVPRVLRNRVLERLERGAVEEAKDGGHHLQVVLEHGVAIGDGPFDALELAGQVEGVAGAGGHVGAEAQLVHLVAHVELFERVVKHLDHRIQIQHPEHLIDPSGRVALLLPLPVGREVQVAPASAQGDIPVDVASLPLLV
mmetsp:Transcript_36946/g.78809  ORF Transcript_36946/g.78809 Transcript_36946/m.78809 type:complete len:213 (+) Transcript_36946:319-957(+)